MAKGLIGKHLMGLRSKGKMAKPSVRLTAHVDDMPSPSNNSFEVERAWRLTREIEALQSKMTNLDVDEVIDQARRSINAELARKRGQLMECRASLDLEDGEKLPKAPKRKKGIDPEAYDTSY